MRLSKLQYIKDPSQQGHLTRQTKMMLVRLQRFAANPKTAKATQLRALPAAPLQSAYHSASQGPSQGGKQRHYIKAQSAAAMGRGVAHRGFSSASDKEQSDREAALSQGETEPAREPVPEEAVAESGDATFTAGEEELSLDDIALGTKGAGIVESRAEAEGLPEKTRREQNLFIDANQYLNKNLGRELRQLSQDLTEEEQLVTKHLHERSEMALNEDFDRLTDVSQVEMLKHVVSSPDYEASKQYLNGVSSPAVSSVQQERQRTMNRMAAYSKSQDILKLVKARLATNQDMQGYLTKQLNKSSAGLGRIVAGELTAENRSAKESDAEIDLALSQARDRDAKQSIDNVTAAQDFHFLNGAGGPVDNKLFVPSNPQDRFFRHEKSHIKTLKDYQEYLEKVGLQKELRERQKKVAWYDKLFEKYQIPQSDRNYIFQSDIEKPGASEQAMFEVYQQQYQRLVTQIPELRFQYNKPGASELAFLESVDLVAEHQAKLEELNQARQPYIEKHLNEVRPKFEAENSSLSEADRERKWAEVVEQANKSTELPIPSQVADAFAKRQSLLNEAVKMLHSSETESVARMADAHFQKIVEYGSDPNKLARVTNDGPKDTVGDLQDLKRSGPFYDMAKIGSDLALESDFLASDVIRAKFDQNNGVESFLEENYDYAKKVETTIDADRKRVAKTMLSLQKELAKVAAKRAKVEQLIVNKHNLSTEQQLLPGQKAIDFIQFADEQAAKDRLSHLNNELDSLLATRLSFDPKSKSAAVYERELKLLSTHALLNEALGKPDANLDHFVFVLGAMSDSKIPLSSQLAARTFEYAVLADKTTMANDLLGKLTQNRSESLSPVDPRYLGKFFEQSLKSDNIDGVAFLVNYSERYGVDMAEFPVNNFRAALNHYLNTHFDLSKVMTFLKFYQGHIQDKAKRAFSKVDSSNGQISRSALHSLSEDIFGNSDGLVDLPALFDHLVDQTGNRQIMDPFTKEDSIWKLIESQTADKDFVRAASLSEFSKLSGASVARFLGNQLSRASSFDRTFKTALRLQGTPMAEVFFSELMSQLNRYTLSNRNQLPASFTEQKLNDLFVRLQLSGSKISGPLSELLLHCMSLKGMHKQIVSLCTEKGALSSDVTQYYLAESLLQASLKDRSYTEALKSAGVYGESDLSACQLTQKTKALFLEGSNQSAVDFFRAELAKREDKAAQRKGMLVALYDQVMESSKKLSFEEFRKRHESSALMSKKLMQQAFAVGSLKKIVDNNDYDGIQDAFSLYTVMRQERALIGPGYSMDDEGLINQQPDLNRLSPEQLSQLKSVQERKSDLIKRLHAEDFEHMKQIIEVTKGSNSLDAVAGLDSRAIEGLLDIFKDLTFEDVRQHASTSEDESSAYSQAEDNTDWFGVFIRQRQQERYNIVTNLLHETTKHSQNGKDFDIKAAQVESKLLNLRQSAEPVSKLRDILKPAKEIDEEARLEQLEVRLEQFSNLLENMESAQVPQLEQQLKEKWLLHAKKVLLAQEQAEPKFSSSTELSKRNSEQMLNYARAMALIQLEAKALQESLSKLSVPDSRSLSNTSREIYNINDGKRESKSDDPSFDMSVSPPTQIDQLLSQHKLNKSIDESWKLINATVDFDAQILPDGEKFQAIEEQARQEAHDLLNNSARKQAEDESESMPKKELKEKGSKLEDFEMELKEREMYELQNSYQFFYFDQKSPFSGDSFRGGKTHPRQLINEIESISNEEHAQAAVGSILQRFGIEEAEEMMQINMDESDSDLDYHQDQHVEEAALRERAQLNSTILNEPMEAFERYDTVDNVISLRNSQTREDINQEDEDKPDEKKMKQLLKYNNRMRSTPRLDDTDDPLNHKRMAHNRTLFALKEELTKAISERKEKALPLALQIFSKLSEKASSMTKLTDYARVNEDQSVSIDSINTSLDKVDMLLNNSSSPLISNIRQTSKYTTQKLPDTIEAYKATIKGEDISKHPVDLNRMINDYRALCKSDDHLSTVSMALKEVTSLLDAKEQDVKEGLAHEKFEQWVKDSKARAQESNAAYMRRLYDEYLTIKEKDNVSDDDKASLLKDVFAAQPGEQFVNTEAGKADSSFPAFYALDLIQFGLKRKIPAAIRLGEMVLSENCETHSQAVMPKELARAVKDFMFEHQEQYQAAARFTGPINATQIYHQARQSGGRPGEQPVVVTYDDPYLQEFALKNYRREDNWRLPSIMAWDHKPYGILGEVLELERHEKAMAEQLKM